MDEDQTTLLTIEDFARRANCAPQEVLRQLRTGEIQGRMVDNVWYADGSALQQRDPGSLPLSSVSAIMLAAANLHWREILSVFEARRNAPLKATTSEFGLDAELVYAEASRAGRSAWWSHVVIGIAALYGLAVALMAYGASRSDEFLIDEEGDTSVVAKLFFALIVIAAADFISRRHALKRARTLLAACSERPPNVAAACAGEQRNVTVSGGYSPFVGSGVPMGGWSFTVDLNEPAKEGAAVVPVTVHELYVETEQSLHKLALPGMAVRDEVFVDGRDVRSLAMLMPAGAFARPGESLSEDMMAIQIGHANNLARHYKVIRIQLWDSQIVLSTLFRYVIVSNTLYVEAKALILPPLKEKFLALQNMPLVNRPWERLGDFVRSCLRATVIWVPVLLRGLAFIQGGFLDGKSRRLKNNIKEVKANLKYNYGWEQSLREIWAGTEYSRYFQMIDQDFYGKMIKETLLDSLLKSLELRRISTESLKNASTRIYNEGVIINGGQVNADSIAAGSGAQATVKKFMQAARSTPKTT